MGKKNKEEFVETYEHRKKRRGDRRDAYKVRDLDSMHILTPYMMPDRTKNEAVLSEVFDLTQVDKYIAKKNSDDPEFKYTFFHFLCAAIAKVMTFRPKMNYFIEGHRYYERKDLSLAFVVKRKFALDGGESLAIIKLDRDSDVPPIEQIYGKVKKFVYSVRKEGVQESTSDIMDTLVKFPRFFLKLVIGTLKKMNYHGIPPKFICESDPETCSCFISNLGSIKMSANYHHLTDWGTNSFFVVVNQKKMRPFFNADGSYEMRDSLTMSFTVDERLADGFYFANCVKLIKKIFENPEIVELPLAQMVPEFEESVTVKK